MARLRLMHRIIPPGPYTMIVSAVIGLVTGLACVVLKRLISMVSHLVMVHFDGNVDVALLMLPVIGLTLVWLFCRYVVRRPLSLGTERLIAFLREGKYNIEKRIMIGPIIANVLTLGFGGSAGAEGPIAVTGAAIASNITRRLGFTPEQVRLFIGCGAGAGIAAIFKAPVGGMLFTLEILRLPFCTFNVLALLLGCLASAMTCYAFTGFTFDVYLQTAEPFEPSAYLALAVFGILAGIYSLYYTHGVRTARRIVANIRPQWAKISVAGLALGAMLLCFPALYGEGYAVMDRMLNGNITALYDGTPISIGHGVSHMALIVGGMLLLKGLAVGFTTGAGVAGDFAPTLFAGSLAGLLFAIAANTLIGCDLPVGDFALIGMCAVFAAVIRAPFMAMFLTPEMTGNFTLMLPMVIASALSYSTVRLIKNKNFYNESA